MLGAKRAAAMALRNYRFVSRPAEGKAQVAAVAAGLDSNLIHGARLLRCGNLV